MMPQHPPSATVVPWSGPLPSSPVTLLAVAAISGRLSGTVVTPAMVFVAVGLLVGPEVLGEIDLESSSGTVRTLAEATLALVLFCDASRIDLGQLRREFGVPVRLLGIGLPLTIALGAVAAAVIFDRLSIEEAVILSIVLAPTDAALGQAVVTEPRVPGRIRQGLNVESGLNDGICVPLLFAAVAAADVQSAISEGRSAATLLLEEIGYGVVGGVVGGLVVAAIVIHAGRRDLIADAVAAGDPRRRRGARLRHRKRARRLGLHRRVRRGHDLPAGAPARPRAHQRPQRAGGQRAQRRHLPLLRGDPARPRARRADLGARPVRGPQPDAGADAARRDRDAGHARPAADARLPRAGSVPAGWHRSCSP